MATLTFNRKIVLGKKACDILAESLRSPKPVGRPKRPSTIRPATEEDITRWKKLWKQQQSN